MFSISSTPKLHLSPFLLSTVMFDNSNSIGDQEGFFIGNAQKSVRKEISDHSMYNTEEDLIISIYSCIPCGSFLSFYDSCGNINQTFVDEVLGERKHMIVGWYRYRRNLVPYPSSREMIVHKNLQKLFPGNICFGDEFFVFGVLGSACYPTVATHTYDYAFFMHKSESFKPLPITLLNLGDTKTEYRAGSLTSTFVNSTIFDAVLSVPWDFAGCWQTEDAMQQMHNMLRDKCDSLAEELTAQESVNTMIEQEVMKLDAELESLTVKEEKESKSVDLTENDSENVTPERVCIPFNPKKAKSFLKRTLKDVIGINEEDHPLFGKFFPQNRSQEPGCSYVTNKDVLGGMHYNFLPPKKKIKVILERKRILDHDYDFASDEDPPQPSVTDEESSDTHETSSDTATVGNVEEEIQKAESDSNDAVMTCPEAIIEEIVTTEITEPCDVDFNIESPLKKSNIEQELNTIENREEESDKNKYK